MAEAGDSAKGCIVTPKHAPPKKKLPSAPGSKLSIQTGGGRTVWAKSKTVAELCEGAETMYLRRRSGYALATQPFRIHCA